MINSILIFALLNTYSFQVKNKVQMNFMIEISNSVDCFFSSQQICFYKEGNKIADDEFEYHPYSLSLSSKCLKYYEMSDSVELRFYGPGIFNEQYEYRVGFDKSFNLLDTASHTYYILSISDMLYKGKSKKVIDKIGCPYIYTIEKDSGCYKHEMYSNWIMYYDKVRIKKYSKLSEQSKLDYNEYRSNFWSN